MRPLLSTFFLIVSVALAVATYYWLPAGFGFVFVVPLALLGLSNLPSGSVSSGPISARTVFILTAAVAVVCVSTAAAFWAPAAWAAVVVMPLILLGLTDMLQRKQSIRRNFPVIGHARYLLEGIRPEIQQYFIEQNQDGRPFPREERSLVYQRAKGDLDSLPFGTQRNVYEVGYEWINHSLQARRPDDEPPRVRIGEHTCSQPYDSSLLNISAMSFGALSPNAIEALNKGAETGGFAHNTGEGSISEYHRQGGDLIWQIGTGYFGCRSKDGRFDVEKFADRAALAEVKMIEVKLSQGAKPGHGGILPAAKITPQIAKIRDVPLGQDVVSPPTHSSFEGPIGLLEFVTLLRERSGGKPVGFKLCIGKRREFLAICKAMVETGLHPDYIAIDGGEGGTGAAPIEFSNSLGTPMVDGLVFAHNALVGIGMRDKVRVAAAGKVVSGFGVLRLLALGADFTYAARSMMLSLGCIQARICNTNACPVGVATQDPSLTAGLVVDEKALRVSRFHRETIEALLELVGAAGLGSPAQLRPWHIMRRISPTEVRNFDELYRYLQPGALLADPLPENFARAWRSATARSWAHAEGPPVDRSAQLSVS